MVLEVNAEKPLQIYPDSIFTYIVIYFSEYQIKNYYSTVFVWLWYALEHL